MTASTLTRPDLLRGAAYIDSIWQTAISILDVSNTADGTLIGSVPKMGTPEASATVSVGVIAFSGWSVRTGTERTSIIHRWQELMLANAEDLRRLLTAEQGKPIAEGRSVVRYAAAFRGRFADPTPNGMDRAGDHTRLLNEKQYRQIAAERRRVREARLAAQLAPPETRLWRQIPPNPWKKRGFVRDI